MTREILFEIVPGVKEAAPGLELAPVQANPQISQLHILNLRVLLQVGAVVCDFFVAQAFTPGNERRVSFESPH